MASQVTDLEVPQLWHQELEGISRRVNCPLNIVSYRYEPCLTPGQMIRVLTVKVGRTPPNADLRQLTFLQPLHHHLEAGAITFCCIGGKSALTVKEDITGRLVANCPQHFISPLRGLLRQCEHIRFVKEERLKD
jgi:hypothetical protein